MERDPQPQTARLFQTFLETFPQVFIFHLLKVYNLEKGKLQGLTTAKDVMHSHTQHPLQQFKPLLCIPYPMP